MSHPHPFTRHSTCMPRLEHDPLLLSSSPSSPSVSDLSMFGSRSSVSLLTDTRLASLKPPALPFPTSKNKTNNFSNWNQRPALKTSLSSSRLPNSFAKLACESRKIMETVEKPLPSMDMDMDFEAIPLRKMPSSPEMSQKKRPIYTSQLALSAEPLIMSDFESSFPTEPNAQVFSSAALSVGMDCDETPATLLPCIESCRDALKRITPATMADVLDGKYDNIFGYEVIDCRFPYEYEGGHIEGAINMTTPHDMETKFFPATRKSLAMSESSANIRHSSTSMTSSALPRVIILHCEFSAQRAPKMGLHLRNHDRNLNIQEYPYLDYPHVFILDGGYKAFFTAFQDYCNPCGYREMSDPEYTHELKKYMGVHKAEFKRAYSTGFLRT
ncbi:Rhodanese-like domain-containing protein [Chytriomyces cf. hyalinus JEL632]|nr:Rhodanese-like domain-containing protein [Chytriomyces cf. hyalinus JEL632]